MLYFCDDTPFHTIQLTETICYYILLQCEKSFISSFRWLNGKWNDTIINHFDECVTLRYSFFVVVLYIRLGAANSSINPILYCYMNKKFRISFMVSWQAHAHNRCFNLHMRHMLVNELVYFIIQTEPYCSVFVSGTRWNGHESGSQWR